MTHNFINTNTKSLIVFVFSAISMVVMTLFTQLSILIIPHWYGLIVGIVLMLLAIPMHILAQKTSGFYMLSFLCNSIGSGFSVAAYYTEKSIPVNSIGLMIAIIPGLAILFTTYCFLRYFSKHKKLILMISTTVVTFLIILSIIFWIKTGFVFFSFGFFSQLLTLFYLAVFGVAINKDRSVLRDISYGSFGLFIILTVVVAVILSEGDILDGFDIGGDGKKKVITK